MLDDGHAGSRRNQRRTGGQVQAAGGIATRPDDIGRKASTGIETQGQCPHRRCQSTQLGWRFALYPQRHQQGRRNRWRKLGIGQRVHQRSGTGFTQILPGEQLLKRSRRGRHCGHRRPAVMARKLPSRRLPSGVSTLSG
jgi:hypothetical protein